MTVKYLHRNLLIASNAKKALDLALFMTDLMWINQRQYLLFACLVVENQYSNYCSISAGVLGDFSPLYMLLAHGVTVVQLNGSDLVVLLSLYCQLHTRWSTYVSYPVAAVI